MLALLARAEPRLYGTLIAGQLDGWIESHRSGVSIDGQGRPLPWFTYPSIAFLAPRILPDMRVFEYGAGQSSSWWAVRVKDVIAVEHDPDWHAKVQASTPANARVLYRPLGQGYIDAVDGHHPFDIVVIDGRRRVDCAPHAAQALTKAGVIVWDNSEREQYQGGLDLLHRLGFRRLDFEGLGPVATISWTTTVFYREENCLGI